MTEAGIIAEIKERAGQEIDRAALMYRLAFHRPVRHLDLDRERALVTKPRLPKDRDDAPYVEAVLHGRACMIPYLPEPWLLRRTVTICGGTLFLKGCLPSEGVSGRPPSPAPRSRP